MIQYEKAVSFWQRKNICNDAELAQVLDSFSVAFAYHSGKIENGQITFFDTREVFDHDGVSSYTGDLRTLFEIRNEKAAYELLLESFRSERSLDENLVKEFHFTLTQNTYDMRLEQSGERPGAYKKHDYVTGKAEVGAAPQDVHEELSELLCEINDAPKEKALTAAAYFHAKFENIHPFADGNGRTGRILLNYYLILNDHPPIIIHEEDRREYYHALECWDDDQVLDSLIGFLKEQTVKSWEKQLSKRDIYRDEIER